MKIGRNDPCPCGSGKKYKKCCLDKDTAKPSTHETAGLSSEAEFEQAMAEYKDYCENQLKPGEPIPSFKEYTTGGLSPAHDVFSKMHSFMEGKSFDNVDDLQNQFGSYLASLEDSLGSSVGIAEALEELIENGVFNAPMSVKVNPKTTSAQLAEAPIIKLLQGFLRAVVESGGTKGNIVTMEQCSERFFHILQAQAIPGFSVMINFANRTPKMRTRLEYLLRILIAILSGLDYFTFTEEGFSIRPNGQKLLSNKDIRRNYLSIMDYYTQEVDWAEGTEYEGPVCVVQDYSGPAMVILNDLLQEEHIVDSEKVFDQLDSNLFISHAMEDDEELNEDPWEEETPLSLFEEHFFYFYCYLGGFVLPVEPGKEAQGSGETNFSATIRWEPTALFKDLFLWNLTGI